MAIDTISKALYSRLTSHAGLGALVGIRVFPGYIPQGTAKPTCYYDETNTDRHTSDNTGSKFRVATFHIVSVADSYTITDAVKAQVIEALEGWTQSTPLTVIESIARSLGISWVEESQEFVGITEVNMQYFVP